MKYSQLSTHNPQHVVLHGDPKSGKSTLATKLAEAGFHLYWISLDSGHTVLSKLSPEAQDRVDIITVRDTHEVPLAAVTVRQLFKLRACHICDAHGQIDCSMCKRNTSATWTDWDFKKLGANDIVVVDHLTQLADSVLSNICKSDFEKDDSYKPTYNNYMAQGTVMHAILSTIQTAPFHVLCIAQSIEARSEDGVKFLAPNVGTRYFSDSVGRYFDAVVYTHVHNNMHKAGSGTLYRSGVLTGSRSDVLVEKMDGAKEVILAPLFKTQVPGTFVVTQEETKKVLASVQSTNSSPSAPTDKVDSAAEASKEAINDASTTVTGDTATVAESGGDTTQVPATGVTGAAAEPELSAAERMKARLAAMRAGKG